MKIAFLCPRCHEIVIGDYTDGHFEVSQECICMEEEIIEWYERLIEDWSDTIILDLSKMIDDDNIDLRCIA